MGSITVILTVTQTVAVANGAALQAIQDWIKVNITDKLPATASVIIDYRVIP